MVRINKISESIQSDIGVLDIEDYLQEVWDNYRTIVKSYSIKREFADEDDKSLYDGDQEIRKGGELKEKNKLEMMTGRRVVFLIMLHLDTSISDNYFEWDGHMQLGQVIELLAQVKNCLRRIDSKEIIIQFTSLFTEEYRGPCIEVCVVSNIVIR